MTWKRDLAASSARVTSRAGYVTLSGCRLRWRLRVAAQQVDFLAPLPCAPFAIAVILSITQPELHRPSSLRCEGQGCARAGHLLRGATAGNGGRKARRSRCGVEVADAEQVRSRVEPGAIGRQALRVLARRPSGVDDGGEIVGAEPLDRGVRNGVCRPHRLPVRRRTVHDDHYETPFRRAVSSERLVRRWDRFRAADGSPGIVTGARRQRGARRAQDSKSDEQSADRVSILSVTVTALDDVDAAVARNSCC